MTLAGITENLVSDVIFLLIAIGLGRMVFVLTRRAKLLKFFGIASSRRITIYLSNLRVTPGGAIGINDRRLSYQGSAAAFGEMLIANRFRDLFNYLIPSLSETPGILSKLLISDVQVNLLLDIGEKQGFAGEVQRALATQIHGAARKRSGEML